MKEGIAIVVGGAASVWKELGDASDMVWKNNHHCGWFIVNDMIEHFSKPAVVCTLHVDKLPSWLANRAVKGMQQPLAVWGCTKEQEQKKASALFCTNFMDDWGGSSGLFALRIALHHYGYKKIILCGIPMTISGNHFVRGKPWNDQLTFVRRWQPHIPFLRPHVRSMSGLTREWFGYPDDSFINSEVGRERGVML